MAFFSLSQSTMKISWYTKITRVEISPLLLIPLRSISQAKQRVSLRLAHTVVRLPWLWADSFLQQELCWLKNLLPTSWPQLLLRCTCASGLPKTNPARPRGSNRNSLITGVVWAEGGCLGSEAAELASVTAWGALQPLRNGDSHCPSQCSAIRKETHLQCLSFHTKSLYLMHRWIWQESFLSQCLNCAATLVTPPTI